MDQKLSYEALKQQVEKLETENKQLRFESQKYRTLFNSFPHAITITDINGNIIETNPITEKLLGVSKEEQQNRTIDGKEWRIVERRQFTEVTGPNGVTGGKRYVCEPHGIRIVK